MYVNVLKLYEVKLYRVEIFYSWQTKFNTKVFRNPNKLLVKLANEICYFTSRCDIKTSLY